MKLGEKTKTAIIGAVMLVVGLGAGYWIGYDMGWEKSKKDSINSFEDCVYAGYPIQESYPERCSVPGGKSFTNSQ